MSNEYNSLKMDKENISQEYRLKNRDETRNYFIEEINQNKLICKKHKKISKTLNYIENLLSLPSTITGCVSICPSASLVGIPVGISSSAVGIKICVITAGSKKLKPIIIKKVKKMMK